MFQALVRRFRDSSLRRKLLLTLGVLFVLPLTGVAVFLNSAVSTTLNARLCATDFEVLKQTRSTVETIARDARLLSLSILSDDALQSLLRSYHTGDEASFLARKIDVFYLLQTGLYDHPVVASICLSDGARVLLQAGQYPTAEPTTWHDQASRLAGAPLWTGTEFQSGAKTGQVVKVLSLIRSVNDLYRRQQLATLRVSIKESALRHAVVSAQTVNGGELYVVDQDGTVLTAVDETPAGQNLAARAWWPVLDASPEGWAKSTASEPATVFHYRVDGTPWAVVQVIPERLLNAQLVPMNILIGVSMVLCLIFGIGLTLLQRRTVLDPLERLSAEMEKVRAGNFEVQLVASSHDEIGNLSRDFVTMSARIKDLVETVYVVKLKEKEAALMSLEAQINPHFLYNTLDAIRWMAVRQRASQTAQLIEALSSLFRHTLNQGHELTTWQEEVAHLENYLFIQGHRFGDRLRFDVRSEPEVLDSPTVKLVLQPLVENSIVHGLEPLTRPGLIQVELRRRGDTVRATVSDDGQGCDAGPVRAQLAGQEPAEVFLALKNLHDRIQLRFGEAFGVEFESRPGGGAKTTVTVPFRAESPL